MDKMVQKPIRVLFIITGLSSGGAEMMLFKLLERMDLGKIAPHVVSLTDIGQIGLQIAALGIPVEAMYMRRGKFEPSHFVRLIWRLRQIKPDLVHAWMYHAHLLGGLAARLSGVPKVIWSVYSSNLLPAETKLLTKLTVSCCARLSPWLPDCIQYDSNHGKDYHNRIGYREPYSIVIPNGVDLKEFMPNEQARVAVRQEIGIDLKTPLIGLIARYDPIKNHEGFIKAASYLHRDMPGVHFLMVGQDVDWSHPTLKKNIEKYDLTSVFHLLGHRDDIPRIMASLDLACLTSWSESFGIVLIEAMACGVPCVSTDCGEQAIIFGNSDWIVPIGDMEGIAAKWATFFTLPEHERRLIGEAARARVMDQFELGNVAKQYEAMYNNLIR